MSTVVFISHRLGDKQDDLQLWHDNLANAGDWVRFFIETTSWVVLAPWYLYAVVNNDPMTVGRRLVDSISAMERCDLVVQCGGVISPHMRDYDARTARRLGLPVVDLTSFGMHPPEKSDEDAVQIILAKVKRAILAKPRRVWLPLLTEDDIKSLKHARHALYITVSNEPGEHDAAIALMDRIIEAASDRGT